MTDRDAEGIKLRRQLRKAGLSNSAIDAAWPRWWSEEAGSSASARTELRFTVARHLGLSAKSLLGERVEFVWKDTARFKHLTGDLQNDERGALNSFGTSVGRLLLRASATEGRGLTGLSAAELRQAITSSGSLVDLLSLLSTCWGLGVPVAYLRVWPLTQKLMHAMVIGESDSHAILLCRETSYPAVLAFTLAHEMGHIALGHVAPSSLLVDAEDPTKGPAGDYEEDAADRYALEVLTGSADPQINVNFEKFNRAELADAVLRGSAEYGIEPGTLALAVAHRFGAWPVAMSAMQLIYGQRSPLWPNVNGIAVQQLALDQLDDDSQDFLGRILGATDE